MELVEQTSVIAEGWEALQGSSRLLICHLQPEAVAGDSRSITATNSTTASTDGKHEESMNNPALWML